MNNKLLKFTFVVFYICLSFKYDCYSQAQISGSPNIKTFALNPDNIGAGASSVNLFTGDVALPIPLLTLPGHNGLDVGVNIAYSSNVQNQVGVWNLEAPTGILGLGWNMDMPKIVADHKQTGAMEDDEFYLIEGGASTRLVRTTGGSDGVGSFYVYELKNYQLWKIKRYHALERWEITKEDGTKYIYGDKNSNRQTVQWIVRWDNWIGNSVVTSNQTQMAQAWNLSEIVNLWNEKVTFEYENDENFVGTAAGKKQTEASYLKRITDVLGRKVEFFYKWKSDLSAFLVQEPHTEQIEPDAYQEFYEKRYLDYIQVLQEDNSKYFSVHFTYSQLDAGTNTAKMLLTSIIQKNKDGISLPGIQFGYYMSDVSNGKKGFLQSYKSATGASLIYNYNTTDYILPRTELIKPISIPNHTHYSFSERYVWYGEDYVVLAIFRVGFNGVFDSNNKPFKLYIYQWDGEWIENYMGEFPATKTISKSITVQGTMYTDLRVVADEWSIELRDDAFAISYPNPSNTNNYHLFLFHKNELKKGKWSKYQAPDFAGIVDDNLYVGDNYIGISGKNTNSAKSYHYLYNSGEFGVWRESNIPFDLSSSGELPTSSPVRYGKGGGNYIIRHIGFNGNGQDNFPVFSRSSFSHLTEDGRWINQKLPNFVPIVHSGGKAYWHTSNSFMVGFLPNDDEYIYSWNQNYANFNRFNLGRFGDDSPTFIINNSMVGISSNGTAKTARFNGSTWKTITITNYEGISFGDDYINWTRKPSGNNRVANIYSFNPNSDLWPTSNLSVTFTIPNKFANSAGSNYLQMYNRIYYRKSNGTWENIYSILNYSAQGSFYDSPVWVYSYPLNSSDLVNSTLSFNGVYSLSGIFTKNGQVSSEFSIGVNLKDPFPESSIGKGIICLGTDYGNNSLILKKILNSKIEGMLQDYPVTSLMIDDGSQPNYTTINYDLSSATVDPSGTVAQYHKVTVANGTNVANNYPNGRTEHYFYNGLLRADVAGNTTLPETNSYSQWMGTPFETKIYDASNTLLASNNTKLSAPYSKSLLNSLSNQVDVAYYVRPEEVSEMKDGFTTRKFFTYNSLGQIATEKVLNHDSKNIANAITVYYKYLWEETGVYNTSANNYAISTLNLLSSVIQTKKIINSIVYPSGITVESSATTWKQQSGIWIPHKTYSWRRTGSADFNFTNWSGAGEPPVNEWIKVSQINQIDSKGNVLETSVR